MYIVNQYLNIIRQFYKEINNKKNCKIIRFLNSFYKIAIAFILTVFLLRFFEYGLLKYSHPALNYTIPTIFVSGMRDILMGIAVTGILLIPFLLISFVSRKISLAIYVILNIIFIISYIALIFYFNTTLIPLDQVIFAYSPESLIKITQSSGGINLLTISIIISVILLFFIIIRIFNKKRFSKPALVVMSVFALIMAIKHHDFYANINHFKSENDYYISANKLAYFARKIAKNYKSFDYKIDEKIYEKIKTYQSYHPEHEYISTKYPYLYRQEIHKTLSKYFKPTNNGRPPNVVYIIVESLSHPISGKYATKLSFTPFLDSLAEKSLYWPNTISTSERTFGVLPGLLGSLPMGGKKALLDYNKKMPRVIDISTILLKNGYDARFFYGSWTHFNNMDTYLHMTGIYDDISNYPGYKKIPANDEDFSWGFEDGAIFDGSFQHIDSTNPYLSIYLTLSTHNPFLLNNDEKFIKKAKEIIKKAKIDDEEKLKTLNKFVNKTATFVYFDESLRKFFEKYKERNDFDNTIFIITGDHISVIFGWENAIANYHVPLIIYSPLLKTPREFKPVASHLDVSPTMVSLLADKYGIKPAQNYLFTGKQLDTSNVFESKADQLFIRNSRETNQIIYNDYFLSKDFLYHVEPGLKLREVNNDSIKQALKQRFDVMYNVTDYSINFNKLIPTELYYKEMNSIKILNFHSSYEITDSNLLFTEKTKTNEMAFRGDYAIDSKGEKFFGFIPDTKMNGEFSTIFIKMSFMIYVKSTGTKNPTLAISGMNSSGEGIYWSSEDIIKNFNIEKGKWVHVEYQKTIHKKLGKDNFLRLYFLQMDPKSEIVLDDMNVKIYGKPMQ
jgi:uncharacterized sulfatase